MLTRTVLRLPRSLLGSPPFGPGSGPAPIAPLGPATPHETIGAGPQSPRLRTPLVQAVRKSSPPVAAPEDGRPKNPVEAHVFSRRTTTLPRPTSRYLQREMDRTLYRGGPAEYLGPAGDGLNRTAP